MNIFLMVLFLVLIGCTAKTSPIQNEEKVDLLNKEVSYPVKVSLQEAIKNVDNTVTLSSFVDNIEYIPLKLPNKYAIREFYLYDYDEESELFFIGDFNRVLVINRNGEFLRTIGKIGGGPGELPQISDVSIDKENKYVYLYSSKMRTLLRYNYEGKFLKKVFNTLDDNEYITAHVFYNHNNFVAISESYFFRLEPVKDRLYGYAVLDTLGKMVDRTAPQCAQLDTEKDRYIGLMFNYQMTRFKEHNLLVPSGLADTIYAVADEKVTPRYLLDYGDDKPDLSKIWSSGQDRMPAMYNSIFIMNPAYETERYFIIKMCKKGVEYIVMHDKYLSKSYSVLYDYEKEDKRGDLPVRNMGFYNDLDGGIDAYPMIMSSEGNYWVSYIEPYRMKELLSEEHFEKRKDVHDLKQQEELKKMLQNIKEEDDQVLVLMKLKKSVL